jgi:hypothetical protein
MNLETGTEAVPFPEKEYINEIFVAVHPPAEEWARKLPTFVGMVGG